MVGSSLLWKSSLFPVCYQDVARPFQNRPQSNGSFATKQQTQPKVVSKQRPQQTLDSLFANMKEERMKVMSHQQNNNNSGRRNGP
ncbi:hypothetical protein Tco_1159769, partial [Tanacetum coccineum]